MYMKKNEKYFFILLVVCFIGSFLITTPFVFFTQSGSYSNGFSNGIFGMLIGIIFYAIFLKFTSPKNATIISIVIALILVFVFLLMISQGG
ncbi:MAG: hypothetical protein ACTSWZ_07850 [Candidatus Heimdallarchaeaceae archaeon]